MELSCWLFGGIFLHAFNLLGPLEEQLGLLLEEVALLGDEPLIFRYFLGEAEYFQLSLSITVLYRENPRTSPLKFFILPLSPLLLLLVIAALVVEGMLRLQDSVHMFIGLCLTFHQLDIYDLFKPHFPEWLMHKATVHKPFFDLETSALLGPG